MQWPSWVMNVWEQLEKQKTWVNLYWLLPNCDRVPFPEIAFKCPPETEQRLSNCGFVYSNQSAFEGFHNLFMECHSFLWPFNSTVTFLNGPVDVWYSCICEPQLNNLYCTNQMLHCHFFPPKWILKVVWNVLGLFLCFSLFAECKIEKWKWIMSNKILIKTVMQSAGNAVFFFRLNLKTIIKFHNLYILYECQCYVM